MSWVQRDPLSPLVEHSHGPPLEAAVSDELQRPVARRGLRRRNAVLAVRRFLPNNVPASISVPESWTDLSVAVHAKVLCGLLGDAGGAGQYVVPGETTTEGTPDRVIDKVERRRVRDPQALSGSHASGRGLPHYMDKGAVRETRAAHRETPKPFVGDRVQVQGRRVPHCRPRHGGAAGHELLPQYHAPQYVLVGATRLPACCSRSRLRPQRHDQCLPRQRWRRHRPHAQRQVCSGEPPLDHLLQPASAAAKRHH
mmetsp:Transcript_27404/g.63177  ORF Transcript_27404/g.63177 Transcript_27404/m.63177 type:complete len:254 (-) Transcript_27404:1635-2396(-)